MDRDCRDRSSLSPLTFPRKFLQKSPHSKKLIPQAKPSNLLILLNLSLHKRGLFSFLDTQGFLTLLIMTFTYISKEVIAVSYRICVRLGLVDLL